MAQEHTEMALRILRAAEIKEGHSAEHLATGWDNGNALAGSLMCLLKDVPRPDAEEAVGEAIEIIRQEKLAKIKPVQE